MSQEDATSKPIYVLRREGGAFLSHKQEGREGPLAFEDKAMADALGDAMGIVAVERSLARMKAICRAIGWPLWLRTKEGNIHEVDVSEEGASEGSVTDH
jgi:hypothetical protein